MQDLIAELTDILGKARVLTGDQASEAAFSSWSRLGTPAAIVRPRSTAEVSAVVKCVQASGGAIVPWGGKTGLVDGADAQDAIALSLERMTGIEEIDVDGATMTVQAGCTLQAAAEAAEASGLLLPLDLGSRGTATIGGTISTNAGGNRVLRYGMMRDMVLGLEAVLADGTVVSALNPLIKNNTGYDIKQLFIGSEGTLGVVTRAVLRLRPLPASQNTAFMTVGRFEDLPRLLRRLERDLAGGLSAFEVMWPEFYDLVTTPPATGRPLLPPGAAFYVLVESLGGDQAEDADRLERALGGALEEGLIEDAVLAKSQSERRRMWALRDDVGQVSRDGPVFTFDVSLKISRMQGYLDALRQSLMSRWPTASLVVFGHLGDGNLHLIIGVGDRDARGVVEDVVYGLIREVDGSISAEHGIGLQKRDYLAWSRSAAEIGVMRALKNAMDPKGVLNPGKVLRPPLGLDA